MQLCTRTQFYLHDGRLFTLHYSDLFYWLRLWTIYHQVTLKNCRLLFVSCNKLYFSAVTIPGRSGLQTLMVATDFVFSTPVHIGSGTHSASTTMCTGALSFGGEAATHPLLAPRLEMVRTTPPSPLCACIGMSARWILIRNFDIKLYFATNFHPES